LRATLLENHFAMLPEAWARVRLRAEDFFAMLPEAWAQVRLQAVQRS